MKKNGFVNNRLRMNFMVKNSIKSKTPSKNQKKTINKNNSSRRYLDLYQNEKSVPKNLLTPDINKKSIKKKSIYEQQHNTLETDFLNFLNEGDNNINNNINLFSNSFDISRSLVNIEEYMNLYYHSKNKNPFLNKINDNEEKEDEKMDKEKIIAKYSYKNKKWILIENFDENGKSMNIYWTEILKDNLNNEKNNELKDFNCLEEINNKYENINKKNKEFQVQLNYYFHKLKEIQKEKEIYIKKNKKLKEEIHKIPSLIELEMNKFKEEAQKNISKKIYELEQENKILKSERYLLNNKSESNILNSIEIKLNSNGEDLNIRKQ